jgi:arsenite-transporting ATPase
LCDGRRRYEAEWLKVIKTEWSSQHTNLWTLSALEEPPQGVTALREVARRISPLRAARRSRRKPARRAEAIAPSRHLLPVPLRPSRSTRLLIVGGKGGVGKTTCAATLALAVAREAPDRRVLLLSTDPAHSIGDVLGEPIGDNERRIAGGRRGALVVREIDAARGWRDWRERYRESIGRVFEKLRGGSHAELTVDRAIVENLLELAPPGMDEIVGIAAIFEALLPGLPAAPRAGAPPAAPRYDLIIVDSAPTGHTLRLLELPAQARAWVQQLMAVVLRYHLTSGVEQLATELVWLSRGLKRLQELLADRRACGFVVVTRPEQLPAFETIRLIEWLRRHQIARRALIVNSVTPPGCARCRRAAERERRQIAAFASSPAWKRSGCRVVLTDASTPPPRGVPALTRWASTWRAR